VCLLDSTRWLTGLFFLIAPQEIQNLRELFGALDEAKSGRIPVAKLQVRRHCSSLSPSYKPELLKLRMKACKCQPRTGHV
jgi:hypothetical protein